MRTRRGAAALFPKTRQDILSALIMRPRRSWYLTDLARHLNSPKTSLQRELANLESARIIIRRVEGRNVHYQANPACPFLPELQGLLAKTSGLVDVLRDALRPLNKRISVAFVFGSVARGEEVAESDVDLMVMGEVGLAELAQPIQKARERLGREVSLVTVPPEEFTAKVLEAGFMKAVLKGPKLFIVGNADDMEAIAGPAPGSPRSADSPGDRVADKARAAGARRRSR